MNVYTWPAAWALERCTIKLEPNVRGASSQYTQSFIAVDLIGEVFVMSGRLPRARLDDGGAFEAFINRLRGAHYIAAWHFARPVPRGTQRGSPTLSDDVLQGASVLPLANLTNGATYKAGDMLGAGGQLFQVADDVIISGTTANVNTANRARADIAIGSGVTWDKPTANWRLPEGDVPEVAYEGPHMLPIDLRLIQTW